MFAMLKMAIMLALTTTGMETVINPNDCVFNHDRMIPRVASGLPAQQQQIVKDLLINLEGVPCSSVITWANGAMDSLEDAKKYDEAL